MKDKKLTVDNLLITENRETFHAVLVIEKSLQIYLEFVQLHKKGLVTYLTAMFCGYLFNVDKLLIKY